MARVTENFLEKFNTISWQDIRNVDIFVVDMIHGFCKEGAMADTAIMDVVPNIKKLLEKHTQIEKEAYFFVDCHKDNAIEFKSFPTHCLAGSRESEIVNELKEYAKEKYIIYKNSTNGFHELTTYLDACKNNAPESIIITGCCTDICVLQLSLTLKTWLNANNIDAELLLPLNCLDTYDSGDSYHPAEKFNQMAITLLQQAGIKIYTAIV